MYLTQQLKRAGKLWAFWSDGYILKVKRTQQAPTVRLNSKTDLSQFEQKTVDQCPSKFAAPSLSSELSGGADPSPACCK